MKKIEISYKTIIFAVFFILSLQLIWLIRELVFSLFIAFIIMSALKPVVKFFEKKGIPRGIAATLIYIVFIAMIINVFTIILPPLVNESLNLFKTLPGVLHTLSPNLGNIFNINSLSQYVPNITNQFIKLAGGIFSNTLFIISTLFFGFYFLLEEELIKKIIIRFCSEAEAKRVVDFFNQVEMRLNAWFWGQLVLMIIVGLMSFIGFTFIGLKYTIALAVLAGLLEVVPNLGPTLSVIPAVLMGLSHSYGLGLLALAVSILIQQLENNLIVPVVMKKAVGLNPIVTLVALIIGGKIGGVLGVLLAIPTTLLLETLIMEIVKFRSAGHT